MVVTISDTYSIRQDLELSDELSEGGPGRRDGAEGALHGVLVGRDDDDDRGRDLRGLDDDGSQHPELVVVARGQRRRVHALQEQLGM